MFLFSDETDTDATEAEETVMPLPARRPQKRTHSVINGVLSFEEEINIRKQAKTEKPISVNKTSNKTVTASTTFVMSKPAEQQVSVAASTSGQIATTAHYSSPVPNSQLISSNVPPFTPCTPSNGIVIPHVDDEQIDYLIESDYSSDAEDEDESDEGTRNGETATYYTDDVCEIIENVSVNELHSNNPVIIKLIEDNKELHKKVDAALNGIAFIKNFLEKHFISEQQQTLKSKETNEPTHEDVSELLTSDNGILQSIEAVIELDHNLTSKENMSAWVCVELHKTIVLLFIVNYIFFISHSRR